MISLPVCQIIALKHKSLVLFTILITTCGLLPARLFAIADPDGPKIGSAPPELKLSGTLHGPPAADISWPKLKGKVVVLEFWATWCGPCVRAIPHLNELADKFKDQPVVFLSVTSENEDVVRLFLKSHPMKSWVGLDDYESLKTGFHVMGIPHAVIVDAQGKIAAIAHPKDIEARHLDEVLGGKKCSLPEAPVYSSQAPALEANDTVAAGGRPLYEMVIREHPMPKNFHGPICCWSHNPDYSRWTGEKATVESALQFVFGKSSVRTVGNGKLPAGYYDFTLSVPPGYSNELQSRFSSALRTNFGLAVKRTTREMDVYVMTQIATNAPGFRPTTEKGGGGGKIGGFSFKACSVTTVADFLEDTLGKPVLDETHLDGRFAVDMKWRLSEAERLRMLDRRVWEVIEKNPDGDWIADLPAELREGQSLEDMKRLKLELAKPDAEQFLADPALVIAAAKERLGLDLTLTRRPVEILEVTRQ